MKIAFQEGRSKMIIDRRVKFTERCDSMEEKTTTLYFSAPKDYVCDEYPDATACLVSVELPMVNYEKENAFIEFSPILEDENGNIEYEWRETLLPEDEVEELITMGFGL